MSTHKQRTLGEFDATPDAEPDDDQLGGQPSWEPTGDAGRRCQACGAHVSADFARVAGDNEDKAWACPACVSSAELAGGAAADPDYEHYHDNTEAWR